MVLGEKHGTNYLPYTFINSLEMFIFSLWGLTPLWSYKNAAASRLLNQIVSPAPEKFNYIFRRFL